MRLRKKNGNRKLTCDMGDGNGMIQASAVMSRELTDYNDMQLIKWASDLVLNMHHM